MDMYGFIDYFQTSNLNIKSAANLVKSMKNIVDSWFLLLITPILYNFSKSIDIFIYLLYNKDNSNVKGEFIMKKNSKLFLATFFTTILTLISTTVSLASSIPNDIIDHSYETNKLNNLTKCMNGEAHDHGVCEDNSETLHLNTPDIRPMMSCTACGQYAPIVCAAEAIIYDYGTHKYGLLWTKTCEVVYINSRSASICDTCYNVVEVFGYHDCWEVHKDCGRGEYDVCPCEIS